MLDTMYQKIKLGRTGKELSAKTMIHYYDLISIMSKQEKNESLLKLTQMKMLKKPKLTKRKRHFYDNKQ